MSKMTKEERAARLFCEYLKSDQMIQVYAIEQQDAREGPLVEALRNVAARYCNADAYEALAKYDALDAKPAQTLAQAVSDARLVASTVISDTSHVRVPLAKWEVIMTAVEREEREGKR